MANCIHERCHHRSDHDGTHRRLLVSRHTPTMTRSIRCLTCGTTVTASRQIAGCNCDSDAPTWCALDGDRLITMSYSRWEDVAH